MKFLKKAVITVLILVLILAGLGVKTFYDAGEFKEIYKSNGKPLSGSSVAAVYQGTMLIGSVFDERFLICNLPD